MPSHREVLSPLTTPNIHRQVNKFISPSTSRHVSLKSPVPMLTGEHDDTAEKRERRRSRIIQLQQTVGSPVSPAERRRSLPLSGLSANQLAEHYASCIKLSAENKINSKNAFGLHLIDYMSDLVKKKELDNFQVASTTLDASAKIYAGRVDAIHAETYKVLTGLGRGSDKNKQTEEDEGEEQVTEEQGEEKAKKKKKAKKNHAVETNLKNISVKKLELGFEVDPLFHVMSKTFDEGGSSGLLLNNLRCFDDDQALVLDSHTSTVSADQLSSSQRTSTSLTEIKDMFRGVDIVSNSICPPFSSFDFTDWDSTMETSVVPSTSSAHAFDLNAEPEPIMETETDAADMPVDITDFPADGAFGEEDNAESDSEQHVSEKSVFIGDGKAAQLMQSAIRDLTHGNTGTLLSVLASEPSDYSYFNKALCRIWAGPSHWRRGPLSKDPRFKGIADKSQKAKKTVFRINYDEEEDFTPYLKQSKGTCLTKATLTKYSKDRNTLPKDLHYDADKLFRLFCKSKVMIKRQNTSSEYIDDDIENYDYENTNDRENFCPKGSQDDDDDDGGGDFDFNFTQGGDNYSQEPTDFITQPDDTLLSGTMLTGDKLVAQPNKVAKINIDYAKTAKKLDVKRLKGTIWKLLMKKGKNQTEEIQKDDVTQESSGETSGENAEQTEENKERGNSPDSDKSEEEMQGSCSFQELLNDLPQNVSGNMAKNISVPIAFVCLLHLANEKTLKIESDNMTDLKITQGI